MALFAPFTAAVSRAKVVQNGPVYESAVSLYIQEAMSAPLRAVLASRATIIGARLSGRRRWVQVG